MTVYFLSGLGADRRAFQKIRLPNDWKIVHIDWPQPFPREPLSAYAARVAELIDTSVEYVIVGLSFGGMVATELCSILSPKRTILISSISSRKELSPVQRLTAILGLHRLVPAAWMNKVYPFTNWYFGVKGREEKALLKQIIADTPPAFLKWALQEILHWKNEFRPAGIIHIHGTQDHIFPFGYSSADIAVRKGGHFMVYNKAEEISRILEEKIGSSNAR